MARCPKCGAKLYLKYKVCLSCGSKIDFVTLRKK
ncbi:MAG: zinc-ribbon domain-containing protein, partial [Candidatus Hermodarchaeota archaeon]